MRGHSDAEHCCRCNGTEGHGSKKEVSYKDVLAFKKNTIFPYVLSNGTLHFNRLHLYIIIQAPEVPNHR